MIRRYATPLAFKTALDQRFRDKSEREGAPLRRLRQLVVFDRFLARVFAVLRGVVLKGGVVLELRLARARATKDVDLRVLGNPETALAKLKEAGRLDLGDFFTFEIAPDSDHPEIQAAGLIYEGRRYRAEARLAGKLYGSAFGVDIAFAEPLVGAPEALAGSALLSFAGVALPSLQLDSLGSVTALIGPNGSGKSTILRVLHSVLTCLSKGTICDVFVERDAWERFNIARLTFKRDTSKSLGKFAEHIGEDSDTVTIELTVQQKQKRFCISSITGRNGALRISSLDRIEPCSTITNIAQRIQSETVERDRLKASAAASQAPVQSQIIQHDERIKNLTNQLNGTLEAPIDLGVELVPGGPNLSLVLWDEPENGLHPTRRHRFLDLMLEDERQYVVATHAPEFAPVITASKIKGGRVFRCDSSYSANDDSVNFEVRPVACRHDAFAMVEALGVDPARTLFTANIVIWVEGPSDLIFYRHWLSRCLQDRGILEGFHYTFMTYGGSLIKFLDVCDEPSLKMVFDLLSLCRHPIILVDSDLSEPPASKLPAEFLKQGTAKLLDQIGTLNQARQNAALFKWTGGREIENYLPARALRHAVQELGLFTDEEKGRLDLGSDPWPGHMHYYDFLKERLLACKIFSATHPGAAKGITRWGADHKVELMRVALETDDLQENELLHDAVHLLREIERFIVDHAAGRTP